MPAHSPVAGPLLKAMQDDEGAFRDDALDVHALARILARHADEVVDKRLFSVADRGIVLDVDVADVRSMASAGRHWLNIKS